MTLFLNILICLTITMNAFSSETSGPFLCHVCNKHFEKRNGLSVHIGIKHPEHSLMVSKLTPAKRAKIIKRCEDLKSLSETTIQKQARNKKSAEKESVENADVEMTSADDSDDSSHSASPADETSEHDGSSDEDYVPHKTIHKSTKRKRVVRDQPNIELPPAVQAVKPESITYFPDSLYMTNNEADFNRHLLAVQVQAGLAAKSEEPEYPANAQISDQALGLPSE